MSTDFQNSFTVGLSHKFAADSVIFPILGKLSFSVHYLSLLRGMVTGQVGARGIAAQNKNFPPKQTYPPKNSLYARPRCMVLQNTPALYVISRQQTESRKDNRFCRAFATNSVSVCPFVCPSQAVIELGALEVVRAAYCAL